MIASPILRRGLLALLFALGTVVRIVVMPLPGTSDLPAQKAWSYGSTQDFSGVYGAGGDPLERREIRWSDQVATVMYPPMSIVELAAAGHIYRAVRPDYRDSVLLTVLIKLIGLAWEIAFVAFLLTWGRRAMGAAAAEWSALAFWLSPAVWVSGAALGYTDAQAAVPIVLALIAALADWPILVGLLAAISVLTKPQAVFLLPLLAVLCVRGAGTPDWRALWRAAASGVLTTFAIFTPFIVRGSVPNVMQGMSRMFMHDMLSGQAANLGWIGTWLLRVRYGIPDLGWYRALRMQIGILSITRVTELGYPNARVVGVMLTSAALAWVMWRAWRGVSRPGAVALGAWSIYAYFIFSAQVHENHLYIALPLLALAAGELKALRPAFFWVSAIVTLNVYLFEGLGNGHPPLVNRHWTVVDMTVVLSVINVCVFVWFTRLVAAGHPRAARCSRRDGAIVTPALERPSSFRRFPFMYWGAIIALAGFALYLVGVSFALVRFALDPGGRWLAVNRAIVWYSGVPTAIGFAVIAIDLLFCLPCEAADGPHRRCRRVCRPADDGDADRLQRRVEHRGGRGRFSAAPPREPRDRRQQSQLRRDARAGP